MRNQKRNCGKYVRQQSAATAGRGARVARAVAAAIPAAALALWPAVSDAATDTYSGATDANWDTATNWSLGAKPTAADDAIFPSAVPGTGTTVTLGANELANSLTFQNTYTLTGGSLTLTSPGNVTVTAGSTTTLNSVLQGAANPLTLAASNGLGDTGGGALVLGGTNTFTGAVNVNAGTLRYSVDANLGAAANVVQINGGTLQVTAGITTTTRVWNVGASGGTVNLSSTGQYFANAANRLTGSGPLTVTGVAGSNLRLALANSYSGTMTIQSGGNVELGVLGAVAATAPIIVNSGGELDAQNAVSFANPVTVNGGTLSFENGTTGTYSGTVSVGASGVTFGLRDWYNLATVRGGVVSGLISGSGPVAVNSGSGANGVLTLSNAGNSFTGQTTVTSSVVRAADGSTFPTASNLNLVGGLFETTATTFARGLGTGAGQVSLPSGAAGFSSNGVAGTFNIGGAGATLTWGDPNFNPSALVLNAPSANNTTTLSNGIDLAGAARTIAGNGPVANPGVISGAITNTGAAAALIVGTGTTTGVVQLTNAANTGISSVTLTSGELGISADGNIGGATTPITFNGGTLQVIGTTLTSPGAHPYTFNANKVIGFDIATAANNFTLTGAPALVAGQTLTKSGAGTLTLAAASNTVTTLNMNGGTLDIGATTLNLTNAGGSTIQSTAGGTINATGGGVLKISSAGGTNHGDNGTANGTTLTINAKITANGGAATNDGLEVYGGATSTGVVVLTNVNNDFTGDVNVDGGILSVPAIGAAGAVGPMGKGSNIFLANGTSGTLRYTGTGESTNRVVNLFGTTTGGVLDQSGTGLLKFTANAVASGAGAKTMTFTGSTAGTGEFAGVIPDNSATNVTSIQKAGSGAWTLSGANTYTGLTQVDAGVLNVASLSDYGVASAIGARPAASETATGNGIGIWLRGGTLQYTGSTPQSTNRQMRLIGNTTGPNGITSSIDASGSVPSATLNFTYNGVNTNLFETAGFRTLQLTGTNTGANTFGLRLIDQAATTGITSLTKNGTGNWVLTNPLNTFTGGVNINQGSLVITNSGALGTGTKSITLTNGTAGNPQLHLDGTAGSIALPSTFTYATSNNSSGTTGAIFNDAGNNTIQGTINPTSGGGDTGIVVSAGSLTISANVTTAATGLGTRNLRFRGPGNGTLSGTLTNGSSVVGIVQEGTGVWNVTGIANTFSGGATVTSGTLLANNASGSAFGTSAVTVSGTGTLGGAGFTGTGAVTVNPGGTVNPGNSPGTLSIAGPVTFGNTGTGTVPTYLAEIKPSAAPVAGTDNDLLALTGAGASGLLTLSNPDRLNIVPLTDITSQTTYTIATFASETGVFDTVLANGQASQSANPGAANYVLVTYNPTNIQVTVNNLSAAVPEPATAGAVGLVAAAGLLARRRRPRR